MDNVHVPQSPLRAGSPLGQRDGGEDSFGAPEQPVQNAEVGYRVVPDGEEEDARAGEAMEAGNVSGFSNPDFVAELSPPKMGSIASRRTSQVGWRSSSFVSCMRVCGLPCLVFVFVFVIPTTSFRADPLYVFDLFVAQLTRSGYSVAPCMEEMGPTHRGQNCMGRVR